MSVLHPLAPLARPPGPPGGARAARRRQLLALVLAVGLLHLLLLAGVGPPERRWGGQPALQVTHIEAVLPPRLAAAPAEPAPDPAPVVDPAPTPRRAPTPSPAPQAPIEPTAAAPTAVSPEPPGERRGATAPVVAEAATSDEDAEPDGLAAPDVGDQAPPRYATRLPGPAQLLYRLQRGPLSGEARLLWQPEGEQYQLRFDARLMGRTLIEQHSQGRLDSQGLVPDRFTDKRRSRSPQAALFQHEEGRIRFTGPPVTYPAWPGAQDRLGWVVQLAGIYAAAAEPPAEVRLFVVGARGGAGLWTFRLQGREPLQTPLGAVQALYLKREPERSDDQRVEAWLDPARGHWPVRVRTTPIRGGPALEWWLASEP